MSGPGNLLTWIPGLPSTLAIAETSPADDLRSMEAMNSHCLPHTLSQRLPARFPPLIIPP